MNSYKPAMRGRRTPRPGPDVPALLVVALLVATHARSALLALAVCLTLTAERCKQLDLPLMVSDNKSQHTTNFTVSIEAAEGVSTGISAADRALTVRAAVKANAKPTDIERSEGIDLNGYMRDDHFECTKLQMKCPSKYKDDKEAAQKNIPVAATIGNPAK